MVTVSVNNVVCVANILDNLFFVLAVNIVVDDLEDLHFFDDLSVNHRVSDYEATIDDALAMQNAFCHVLEMSRTKIPMMVSDDIFYLTISMTWVLVVTFV